MAKVEAKFAVDGGINGKTFFRDTWVRLDEDSAILGQAVEIRELDKSDPDSRLYTTEGKAVVHTPESGLGDVKP